MKTEVKKLEKNQVKLTVEVPSADVGEALNRAARSLSEQVNIPGFRRGKVPVSVIEQRLGKEALVDQALREELPIFYAEAVAEGKVEPIAPPKIDVVKPMERGKAFVFDATIDVKPPVKLGPYKGVKVEKAKVTVTKQEMEAQVAALQDRFSELKETLKIKAENGDFAVIDFNGTVDGQPFEGGSGSDFLVEIGAQNFWKEFEDQLVGMTKGQEKTVVVHFPEDYPEKKLVGKAAYFKVTLKELKQKTVPAYDDEFAKKVGFKNKQELEEDIESRIKELRQFQVDVDVRRQAIKAVTDAAKVDVPQVMTDDYAERLLADFTENLAKRGMTLEDYAKYIQKGVEDVKKEVAKDAGVAAKSDLVFEAIAKKEKIAAADDELDKELEGIYARMGEQAKRFKAGPDGQRREQALRRSLRDELVKRKTVDFLVKNAQYREKKEEKKGAKKE